MKMVPLFFVMMVAVVLLPGTSRARQADHSSRQETSQSGDKSYSNYQRDVKLRHGVARSREVDQISKRSASLTKATTQRGSTTIHSQPAVRQSWRLNKTLAANGSRIDTSRTVTGPQETSRESAVPMPSQAVSHRNLPAPSSAVSVNGQQFKNSRDPGAHLAVSGGPLTSSRGTAAINGTDMKRKP
jgi:Sperm antigen HE2